MATLGKTVDSAVAKAAPKALNAGKFAVGSGKSAGKAYVDGTARQLVSFAHIGVPVILGLLLGGPLGFGVGAIWVIIVGMNDGVIWD